MTLTAKPQPGLLNGVVRLAQQAEHPVGDRPQVPAVRFEPLRYRFCSFIGHRPIFLFLSNIGCIRSRQIPAQLFIDEPIPGLFHSARS
jgi:hypothetical protein